MGKPAEPALAIQVAAPVTRQPAVAIQMAAAEAAAAAWVPAARVAVVVAAVAVAWVAAAWAAAVAVAAVVSEGREVARAHRWVLATAVKADTDYGLAIKLLIPKESGGSPFTREELQRFLDYADEQVDRARLGLSGDQRRFVA